MAKTIPASEFKVAVKALNAVLKENEETPVKTVGVEGGKAVIIENFTNVVLDYMDNDRTEELPEEVIDLYNEYLVDDEDGDEEPEEKPASKKGKGTSAKGGTKGKGTAGKGGKGGKSTASKKKAGPSVVELTVDLYMKGTKNSADIVKKLKPKFPGRNISSTVSSAMCVLKHVEKHL